MKPDPVAPNVYRFEKLPDTSGWGINMLAAVLPDFGVVLYSPTWLGAGTFEAVDALGPVKVIIAPNGFHHLSLKRFREKYTSAIAAASGTAIKRLETKGHQGLVDLSQLKLPAGVHVLEPEGLKNGEAWLSLPGELGTTWIVCDAWFNVKRPFTGFMGAMLRALKTGPGLAVNLTFRWLAVGNVASYVASARALLEAEKPTSIVVCHGDAITSEGGTAAHEQARDILDRRLG
ncbi:MAG: hypothetical protein IPK82_40430 [Polyangiaceae bacterium]|nr:hypothetical protein [Polyangiaceae bacterium]